MTKKTQDWKAPAGRTLDPTIVQAFLDEIGNGFFSVSFYNKAGEIREIKVARLNVVSRMANNEISDSARDTLARHALIPVVDLAIADGKGWRSFKADRVARIAGAGFRAVA